MTTNIKTTNTSKKTFKPALTHAFVSLIFIAIASTLITFGGFIEINQLWVRIAALIFITIFTIAWFTYADAVTNEKISIFIASMSYTALIYSIIFTSFAINTITTTSVLTWFIVGKTLILAALSCACIFKITTLLNLHSET